MVYRSNNLLPSILVSKIIPWYFIIILRLTLLISVVSVRNIAKACNSALEYGLEATQIKLLERLGVGEHESVEHELGDERVFRVFATSVEAESGPQRPKDIVYIHEVVRSREDRLSLLWVAGN